MDVYSAQYVFGRGKNFDRIDIQTEPGVSVEQVQAALRSKLPAAIEVERPASRGKNIENVMAAMQQGMLITSYVALLVGIFIIFNSFTISVNQRWKEIGILRSLGVERRNIALMFMGEALVIGVIGSLVGIVAGLYLAQGAAKILSIVAATIFGLAAGVDQPVFRWDFAATTVVLGVWHHSSPRGCPPGRLHNSIRCWLCTILKSVSQKSLPDGCARWWVRFW